MRRVCHGAARPFPGVRTCVAARLAMPRKQRFKPSRKPPVATSPQVDDDRQEINPDDVESGTPLPPREQGVAAEDPVGERSR